MLYQLHTYQKLATDIETAWGFLSNPRNLERITPEMGFVILSGVDRPMFAGQLIQYIVSPFPGLRTKWVTEITHIKENSYFVDEQRYGPYSLWHHKHFIEKTEGGIIMEDIVDYKLPLGFLGRFMHFAIVRRKLDRIFKYRKERLDELFGKIGEEHFPITIRKIS